MCRRLSSKIWASLNIQTMIFLAIFNLCYVSAEDSYVAVRFEVTVYGDGLAHLRIYLKTNMSTASISISIPKDSGNIIVTDEAGRLVQYDHSDDNLVIYTLGEESILLEYDTSSLTLKEGPVWTLRLELPVQGTVQLPEGCTIIYLSGLPNSITAKGSRPVLNLAEGSWEVSYVIPIPVTGTVPSATTSPPAVESPHIRDFAAIVPLSVSAVILAVLYIRRKRLPRSVDLSPLDSRILEFIKSRGGKVFESEIRDGLGLPKTSVWRRVRRLQRMGYVKMRRVGLQNQVEVT